MFFLVLMALSARISRVRLGTPSLRLLLQIIIVEASFLDSPPLLLTQISSFLLWRPDFADVIGHAVLVVIKQILQGRVIKQLRVIRAHYSGFFLLVHEESSPDDVALVRQYLTLIVTMF